LDYGHQTVVGVVMFPFAQSSYIPKTFSQRNLKI